MYSLLIWVDKLLTESLGKNSRNAWDFLQIEKPIKSSGGNTCLIVCHMNYCVFVNRFCSIMVCQQDKQISCDRKPPFRFQLTKLTEKIVKKNPTATRHQQRGIKTISDKLGFLLCVLFRREPLWFPGTWNQVSSYKLDIHMSSHVTGQGLF